MERPQVAHQPRTLLTTQPGPGIEQAAQIAIVRQVEPRAEPLSRRPSRFPGIFSLFESCAAHSATPLIP